ncbi:DUF4215 domain-containing protein [Nannocystis bainbridge]|uniref:DUF4215 domain-containing protein n=1 Tax=Nannocystis bainbridge TaxID=2995303 RepID=A0ABT5E8R9_9BACT|nr:DUF4215 domain-containing protein [Nannocystis bainbridge]MDC0722025.1 DUF4215 domain-containing protein [Nannocystis bainbridge]
MRWVRLGLATLATGCFYHPTGTPAAETTSTTTSPTTAVEPGSCGDFVKDDGEACDGGPAGDGVCTPSCTYDVCGDGYVGKGEGCDGGENCVDCELVTCGDGIIDPGEACDDGDADDTDDCLATCKSAGCGDGFVHAGAEQCDDGNDLDTDACVTGCKQATCGDGFVLEGSEFCDDGNDLDDDDCPNSCAAPGCGDGVVSPGEACDDGNTDETDACLNTCGPNVCGDGKLHMGVEACDDGNLDPFDACREDCTFNICGDGYLDPESELCDHGPRNGDDPAKATCRTNCTRSGFLVFVSSQLLAPGADFEAISGGDERCGELAAAGELDIRGGRWKAWLGDGSVGPVENFHKSAIPYYTLHGGATAKVADNWSDLADGTLDNPIDVTDLDQQFAAGVACDQLRAVWTGVRSNNTYGGNCAKWSWNGPAVQALTGDLTRKDAAWTEACSLGCTETARLYCFEQP